MKPRTTPEQLDLLDDSWVRREELNDLAAYITAAHDRGHMGEGEYEHTTSWPALFCHRRHGLVLAWMQRARPFEDATGWDTMAARQVKQRVVKASATQTTGLVFRVVFTDRDGYVVDESAWCTTEGGARGYRNRARD